MIKVTVVVATFNDSQTIIDAVESVLAQTYQHWELIIVDDSSSDGTWDMLLKMEPDDRIKLIQHSENKGSGAARNLAVSHARGEYIAVLDADDFCYPERLAIQAEALDSNSDLTAVGSQVNEFGPWGGPRKSNWPTDPLLIKKRQTGGKMPLPHPSVMFRKAAFLRVGGYDEACRRAQDFALFLRFETEQLACLPNVLVAYRTTRPVSFAYVLRNNRYARLARRRYELDRAGTPRGSLPMDVPITGGLLLGAFKSWILRSLNDRRVRS